MRTGWHCWGSRAASTRSTCRATSTSPSATRFASTGTRPSRSPCCGNPRRRFTKDTTDRAPADLPRRMSPPRNIALALLTALALAPAGLAAGMEQQYWTGHNTTELEPFYAEGAFKVTLGAWCFEGIGFVRAVLYDEAGTEVGRVQIIGEGVTDAVFETPPGQYRFDVIVSHWHIYTWEVLVEPLDAGEAAPQGPATAAPAGAAAGSAPSVGEQGDVVEIHMVSDGEDVYFDPIGVWVEPGTTIRFVLMSGVHDTQAYHPSNSTTLRS